MGLTHYLGVLTCLFEFAVFLPVILFGSDVNGC